MTRDAAGIVVTHRRISGAIKRNGRPEAETIPRIYGYGHAQAKWKIFTPQESWLRRAHPTDTVAAEAGWIIYYKRHKTTNQQHNKEQKYGMLKHLLEFTYFLQISEGII